MADRSRGTNTSSRARGASHHGHGGRGGKQHQSAYVSNRALLHKHPRQVSQSNKGAPHPTSNAGRVAAGGAAQAKSENTYYSGGVNRSGLNPNIQPQEQPAQQIPQQQISQQQLQYQYQYAPHPMPPQDPSAGFAPPMVGESQVQTKKKTKKKWNRKKRGKRERRRGEKKKQNRRVDDESSEYSSDEEESSFSPSESSSSSSGSESESEPDVTIIQYLPPDASQFPAQDPSQYVLQDPTGLQSLPDYVVFNEIRFIEELGKGSRGVVSLGEWRGSPVAIKKYDMPSTYAPDQYDRFVSEVLVSQYVSHHPHVASFLGQTYDPENTAMHIYIIYEYYANQSVIDYLRKNPSTPWKDVLLLAQTAAAGVMHLHMMGVIHRDVGVSNVLLDNDKVSARVIDFCTFAQDGTAVPIIPLSDIPATAAPESLQYGYFTQKADSFSFGMFLWALAKQGVKPYEGKQSEDSVRESVIFKLRRPAIDPQWDLIFRVLINWCWDQQPERRPSFNHIWGVLSEYRKQVLKKDTSLNDPDDVLRTLMLSVTASPDGIQPDFCQVQGLIDSYLRCKGFLGGVAANDDKETEKGNAKELEFMVASYSLPVGHNNK